MEGLLEGASILFQPVMLIALLVGVVIGIVLGIIPGVSGGTAIVLILPFLYGMDANLMLPFLCAMYAVSYTGGSVMAVLTGIPGDAANAATVLDGYEMTRKGEGGRGVGAAVTASSVGGILSIIFALIMMPFIVWIVLKFRSPEMFLMIVLGLSFLAVIAKGSMWKGLISAALGILISCVGYQAITGVPRFTFGILYLYDGLDVVTVLMGLFAITVLVDLIVSGENLAQGGAASAGSIRTLFIGFKDVFKNFWLTLRCSGIGYIVGLIPGIGGSTAIWTAYGHAKQSSKNSAKFGTGCVEGVIGPESANNAKDGGALLTTLAFGIPGSGIMVLFLAAFMMMGLIPGPKMITDHTGLTFALLLSVALANILAGMFCFFCGPLLLKLTRISSVYLFALLMPLVFIGVYSYNGYLIDVIIMLGLGVFGVFFRKLGYSIPALILGFVLGSLFEYHLWHSLDLYNFKSFMSPLSIILVILIAAVLCQDLLASVYKKWLKPMFKRQA